MNRKGLFAIIGAFIVVLTLVVAIVWFFGLYQTVFKVNGLQNNNNKGFTNAQLFKDRLLFCHEKTFLSEEKLQLNTCTKLEGVAGFKVLQPTGFGCAQKNWSVGIVGETDATTHVYWVNVQQTDGTTCIARLLIYQ